MSVGAAAAPHPAAASQQGSVASAAGVGITAVAFVGLPETGLNATRPIPSVCEILYSIRQTLTEEVGPVLLAGRREGR